MSHIAHFEFLDQHAERGGSIQFAFRPLQAQFELDEENARAIHAGWVFTFADKELSAAERVQIYLTACNAEEQS
jgi:hypothetical protein